MIKTNITEMFGIKYPIIAAPMGPFYTTKLTVAVSEAGGLGVLSHTNLLNTNSVSVMKKNLQYVVDHTDKPFGLNIRTSRMQPDAGDLCSQIPRFILKNPKIRDQCKYILTSAGSAKMLPNSKSWQKLKASGSEIKHFHVAPALWLAEKCLDAGVDGLVVTGTEGGGHQSYEKVSTLVLLQQLHETHPEIPIIACGGFATGEGLAAALSLGAGAVAMGTRFIASEESEFPENYKNIIPSAKATDTALVTGMFGPIRLWKNKYCASLSLVEDKTDKIAQENAMDLRALYDEQQHYEIIYSGNIDEGAVLLGQSIGVIESIETVENIMESIIKAAKNAILHASYLLT